ncbi:MAG: right-handed parallel beta-helix repeat-containing protein [Candidatus Hodarchaeales archaeon]|jgi:parallel beta-helix repeat protein
MKCIYLLVLCICTIIIINPINARLITCETSGKQFIANSNNTQVHDPIRVNNDDDLRAKAVDENWDVNGTRDGSPTKPYIISNVSITLDGERLIWIEGTTLHLIIKNNLLFGGGTGISLWNTYNIIISNNHIYNNANSGIDLQGSNSTISKNIVEGNNVGIGLFGHEEAIIIENEIHGNTWKGIGIEAFNNVSIIRNQIYENGEGLEFLMFTLNTLVFDNDIHSNSQNGVFLGDNFLVNITKNRIHENARNGIQYEFAFEKSIINDNLIFNNSNSGIEILWATNLKIINNTISNHDQYGIAALEDCHNLTITRNNISFSELYGISLTNSTSENNISLNNFFDNSMMLPSQAFDSGVGNSFIRNFWNEWTIPDNNSDSYVDIPYRIDGEAKNFDQYPLANPFPFVLDSNNTQVDNTSTEVTSVDIVFLTSGLLVQNTLLVLFLLYISRKKQKWLG